MVWLTFDEATGRVGQEVALPIRATANAPLRIPFKVVLRFPPSKLAYQRLGIGPLPRRAGWTLSANLRKTPPAFDMYFLEIHVEPSSEEFFPEGGLMAEAYFTVVEASQEHSIELVPSVKPITETELLFETEPAIILAQPEAMFACFFYMH